METRSSSSTSSSNVQERLRKLQQKRTEARRENQEAVVEEERKAKLPANFEARQARLESQVAYEHFKIDCASKGLDPERVHSLDRPAEECERIAGSKRRQQEGRDPGGFTCWADSTRRNYDKSVRALAPNIDVAAEQREREAVGDEAFYPTANSLDTLARRDKPEDVRRLQETMTRHSEVRSKYSRRRRFDPDADVDFINEKNRKLNARLEYFYGKYTREIKQNLERGTAV